MKRLFITAIVSVLLSGTAILSSCGKTSKEVDNNSVSQTVTAIEQYLASFKDSLPADLGNGMICTDMYISDGYFTQVYVIDKNVNIAQDTPEARATVRAAISPQILDLLRNDSIGIRYVYRQKGSGKEKIITIPAAEL